MQGPDTTAVKPKSRRRVGAVSTPRPVRAVLGTAVVVLLAVALPLVVRSDRWTQIFLLMVIYAGLGSGLNLLVGYTGLLDLGYIAFYAVGAYTTSLLTVRVVMSAVGPERFAASFWWVPYADVIPAMLIAGCVAGVLGYPTLRARGDYLAIMTLGLGEIVGIVAVNWTGLTRGASGIPAVPPFAIGQQQLFAPLQMYYVGLAIVLLLLGLIARLVRSHVARVWKTIREDELVAESLGVRTPRYKLAAYVCGGAIAGCVGVILAHTQQFVSPDSFQIEQNFVVLAIVIVGGRGTIVGPIVGAILWVGFDQLVAPLQFMQANPEMRQLAVGVAVLVILITAPEGLVPTARGRWSKRKVGQRSTPPKSDDEPRPAPIGGDAPNPGGVLSCNEVRRSYGGVTAVDGVSMRLCAGEVVGVIGPNGAGKTTLIDMLSGIERPSGGEICVDDTPVRLQRPSEAAERGVARTFQLVRIMSDATVIENVMIGAHRRLRHGLIATLGPARVSGGDQAALEASEVLDYVGLGRYRDQPAGTLSYGDRRRLELARAVMSRPRFLLLDEPAAGMSSAESLALGSLIRALAAARIGVALIEHDVNLVMEICDRVIVLDHGTKIAEGTPREIGEHPEVIAAYLGAGVSGGA